MHRGRICLRDAKGQWGGERKQTRTLFGKEGRGNMLIRVWVLMLLLLQLVLVQVLLVGLAVAVVVVVVVLQLLVVWRMVVAGHLW